MELADFSEQTLHSLFHSLEQKIARFLLVHPKFLHPTGVFILLDTILRLLQVDLESGNSVFLGRPGCTTEEVFIGRNAEEMRHTPDPPNRS